MSDKPLILIISPASAKANNGNWQTASRWAHFLQHQYRVQVREEWDGAPGASLMIALHARRSAASIQRWARALPGAGLVVALTGTDLYRDLASSEEARSSLHMATRLVVLQAAALDALPPAHRAKTCVIYQSAPAHAGPRLRPAGAGGFQVVTVGHLRQEKLPQTYMQAAHSLAQPGLLMLHVGAALDPALGALAEATAAACPHYRWLGMQSHQQARALLAGSDLMVLCSAMEGGANVIIEAVTSGVAVLASDIAGNRGMLGADYAGYFPVGDSAALAAAIGRTRRDPAFAAHLRAQGQARAALFDPAREQAALLELVDNMLPPPQDLT